MLKELRIICCYALLRSIPTSHAFTKADEIFFAERVFSSWEVVPALMDHTLKCKTWGWDSIAQTAFYPAATGSILGVPKNFLFMWLIFIDGTA